MSQLIGEFDCKLDTKGRLMVPSNLKRQLPDADRDGLVINRGFEKHLVIYTKAEWDKIVADLSTLNSFEAKTREFIRYFTRGATELSLDSANRILIPKSLLEFAEIKSDIVLSCQFNKIELWSKTSYDTLLDNEPENFAKLAEEVMGKGRVQNG